MVSEWSSTGYCLASDEKGRGEMEENEAHLVALAAEQEVHRAVANVLVLVGGDVLGEQIDVHLAGALLPSALRSRLLAVRVLCLLLQFIQFIVQSVHSEIHAGSHCRYKARDRLSTESNHLQISIDSCLL